MTTKTQEDLYNDSIQLLFEIFNPKEDLIDYENPMEFFTNVKPKLTPVSVLLSYPNQ